MDGIYEDEFEFDEPELDDELFVEDEEDDGEALRRRRRAPPRAIRPYGVAARGVTTGQISNGAGKTAQIQLPAPAVTMAEFRKAMGQVQRDVQGSARAVRELRVELDQQRKATRQAQKQGVYAARIGLLTGVLDNVKSFIADYAMNKAIQEKPANAQVNGVAVNPTPPPPPAPPQPNP
jgi:hypothetical protein